MIYLYSIITSQSVRGSWYTTRSGRGTKPDSTTQERDTLTRHTTTATHTHNTAHTQSHTHISFSLTSSTSRGKAVSAASAHPTLTHRLWGCVGEVVGSPRADRCVLRVCDDRGPTSHRFWCHCQASRVIISGFAPYSQRLISLFGLRVYIDCMSLVS